MNILYSFILVIGIYFSDTTALLDDLSIAAKNLVDEQLHKRDNSPRGFNPAVWWELFGRHEKIKEFGLEKKLRSTVRVSPLKYGEEKKHPARIVTADYETIRNDLTTSSNEEYTKTLDFKSYVSWKTKTAAYLGLELTASAGIPNVADFSASSSYKINLDTESQKADEKQQTVTRKYSFSVPPRTTYVLTLNQSESMVEIPWTCDIKIYPMAAVWYRNEYKSQHFWWYPLNLSKLQTKEFQGNENYVLTKSSGVFKAMNVKTTALYIRESKH